MRSILEILKKFPWSKPSKQEYENISKKSSIFETDFLPVYEKMLEHVVLETDKVRIEMEKLFPQLAAIDPKLASPLALAIQYLYLTYVQTLKHKTREAIDKDDNPTVTLWYNATFGAQYLNTMVLKAEILNQTGGYNEEAVALFDKIDTPKLPDIRQTYLEGIQRQQKELMEFLWQDPSGFNLAMTLANRPIPPDTDNLWILFVDPEYMKIGAIYEASLLRPTYRSALLVASSEG